MRYLGLEFYKLKRRHVFLTVLALFLAETFFILYSAYRSVARGGTAADLPWENLLMQIALLNGLFCPFPLAVAASRVCDVEHKGDTWKLLSCCSERMSSLYSAKFACCMILTAAAQAIQYFLYAGYGFAAKYPGAFPAEKFLASYAGTMLINVGVLAVQEFFSMAVANQSCTRRAGVLFHGRRKSVCRPCRRAVWILSRLCRRAFSGQCSADFHMGILYGTCAGTDGGDQRKMGPCAGCRKLGISGWRVYSRASDLWYWKTPACAERTVR